MEPGYAQDAAYVREADYPQEEGFAPEPDEAEGSGRPYDSASRPAPSRLDPELCYTALVSYIDTFEKEPSPQRLADWLTKEYGVTGTRPDGSVHHKDVAELFPELRDRYAAAGRD